jgi:hypothetical protein
MKYKVQSILVALFIVSSVFQAFSEPFHGWKQVQTEHFVFIFEEYDKDAVNELVTFCEEVYTKVTAYFDSYPETIKCLVLGRIDLANGSFSFPPSHLRLYVTAPTQPWLGSRRENWLKLLLVHELTHYVHLAHNEGFMSWFSHLFGRDLRAGNALFLPGWMIEGITVNIETLFTQGGRGRNPFFEIYYKAPIIEEKFFSLAQASYSSVYPPKGRIYVAGYIFVHYLMEQYGEDVFARINGEYIKFPLFGPWGAIKKVTGKTGKELFSEMKSTLETKYKPFRLIPEGELISPDEFGDYYLPIKTEKGLYLYRKDLRSSYGIVRFDSETGQEEILLNVTLSDNSSMTASADGETIVLAIHHYGDTHPAGEVILSDLYQFALSTQRVERITRGARLWHPALSPDGSVLVAVQRAGSYTRLVEVDRQTGQLRLLFAVKEANVYHPVFSPDGSSIAFVLNVRGMQDIYVVNYNACRESSVEIDQGSRFPSLNHTLAQPILGPDKAGDYFPQFADADTILFSSDRNGSLELFSYSLSQNTGTLVCRDPIAAYAGIILENGILYASYSSKGYCLKYKSGPELVAERVSEPEEPFAQGESVQEEWPESFVWERTRGEKEKPFYDLPWPVFWLPFPSILNEFTDHFDLGIGTLLFGQSLTGMTSWAFSGAYHWTYQQPLFSFSFMQDFGPFNLNYNASELFNYDNDSSLFTQSFSHDFKLRWLILSQYHFQRSISLSLFGGISHSHRAADPEPFTFPDSFDGNTESTRDSLSLLAGMFFSTDKSGGTLDTYAPRKVLSRWDLAVPLPVLSQTSTEFFNKGLFSFNIPSVLENQIIKLGIKANHSTSITSGFSPVYPRGFPFISPGNRFVNTLDYLFTIAVVDFPLPFGFFLSRISGGLHAEAAGHWSFQEPFLSFDPTVYAGLEFCFHFGYNMYTLPFPLGVGISFRLNPDTFSRFDPVQDMGIYLFTSFDSFSFVGY